MRKRRQAADDGLRPIMRQYIKPLGAWVTTIETGLVTQGVPDFSYAFQGGIEGWCECKATKGFAVVFKPMQIGWHERAYRYGRRSWIAIRRRTKGGKRQGAPVDELYLCAGAFVIELRDEGIDCGRCLFMGDGGPSAWDWDHVRRCLASRQVRR